jgi:hypothetical protein
VPWRRGCPSVISHSSNKGNTGWHRSKRGSLDLPHAALLDGARRALDRLLYSPQAARRESGVAAASVSVRVISASISASSTASISSTASSTASISISATMSTSTSASHLRKGHASEDDHESQRTPHGEQDDSAKSQESKRALASPSAASQTAKDAQHATLQQHKDRRWLCFFVVVASASLIAFLTAHAEINRMIALDLHLLEHHSDVHRPGIRHALAVFRRGKRMAPKSDYHSHHHNPFTVHNETFNFDHDIICPRCHSTFAGPGLSCGLRIRSYMERQNVSEEAAVRLVVEEYPDTCGKVCVKEACDPEDHSTWRYDDAAPLEERAVTHHLTSVIPQYRIPPDLVGPRGNLSAYLQEKKNQYPRRMYLFEYNPSIVILPYTHTIPDMPHEKPVYLASYRVSNVHQCVVGDDYFHMIGRKWPRPQPENLLGLALLRDDLSIIQDTIVDIKVVNYRMENFRLFALNNQVYVASSGVIIPIYLEVPTDTRNKLTLPSLFPSNLTIISRSTASCLPNDHVRRKAKNLNYFVDDETNKIMVEVWPMGPKFPVDVDAMCHTESKDQIGPNKESLPEPSFRTVDELQLGNEHVISGDRGGACCLKYQSDDVLNGTKLLLGVSHERVHINKLDLVGEIEQHSFFSRFYAMEATAPYKPVARTGKMCFGFPTPEEGVANPYATMNMVQLEIGDTYNCPRAHLVTGISYKADDPETVIIGYGVNDCVPRFIEVRLVDVLELLFPDQVSTSTEGIGGNESIEGESALD